MRRRVFQISILIAVSVFFTTMHIGAQSSASASEWIDSVANDYEVRSDVTYATANNVALKMDLYRPFKAKAPTPVVIYIHGGGWIAGNKEQDVLYLLPYLSMGWAAVNVEYRLGNSSLAPAAVEDCRCALRWVIQHAVANKIDVSKIVLTGGSAGGHLSLMTGMLAPGSMFDRQCPTTGDDHWKNGNEPQPKVAAIVNWFGITDVADLLDGPNAKHYAIEWFGSLPNRVEIAKQVSPLTYVRRGLPPVITIHGDADSVVPYSHAKRLHAALEQFGVTNKLVTIPGGDHGGFTREQMVSSYAAIREFLKALGLTAVQ